MTLDFAPVQQEVINDKLVAMHMNNEREINDEIEQKRQAGQIVTSPSYTKKKRRDEIEEYIEWWMPTMRRGLFNLLVVLTAPVKEGVELLQERMEEVCAIGRSDKVGAFLEPCDFRQLKALNTALPIGGRQVDICGSFSPLLWWHLIPIMPRISWSRAERCWGSIKQRDGISLPTGNSFQTLTGSLWDIPVLEIHADQADRDFPDLAWKRR